MRAHGTWRMPQISQGCASGHSSHLWSTGLSWAGSPGGLGAAWAKAAWTAGHESLPAGLQTRIQEQDPPPAWSSSGWWERALQPGLSSVPAAEPSCATAGWMRQGLSLKPRLLPGQGPAVCHRPPPHKTAVRDSSKPLITSVILSWTHLRWPVTVMHRGSNSRPTLNFSTSPLTVSLLVSTWHRFFFLQQTKRHATYTLASFSTSVPDPPVFPTPPINKWQFPTWGSALGIIPTSSGKGSSPDIPYE